MPIPEPRPDEDRDEFLARCVLDDVMRDEFPDRNQRLAVCISQFEEGYDDEEAMSDYEKFMETIQKLRNE